METLEVIVDTSVIIDFLRGRASEREWFTTLLKRRCGGITAITVFELYVGIDPDSKRDRRLRKLMDHLTILPLDNAAAEAAGGVERELRARGESIGVADILIAGICLVHDLPIATRNTAHFRRVPGLKLYGGS